MSDTHSEGVHGGPGAEPPAGGLGGRAPEVVRITEYLDIDLDHEMWCCHVCARELVSARDNYKKGCLVHERDPEEIYPPIFDAQWTLSVAKGYGVFVEFYCPGCGTMVENELLPEGFAPTWDIQLDIDALKVPGGRVVPGSTAGPS